MTKAALDIQFSTLTHLKAALISTEKATQFTNSILLLERLAIPPAVRQPGSRIRYTFKLPRHLKSP
jgi:hypothetical protein